jgi:tetratricopeptide (TPR) repeat protein
LALRPTHIGTTLLLGKIYGKYFNNPDKSIEYLERYVFQFKQNTDPTGWQYLGTAYAIKGRIPEAISALNSCLKLEPDNADAYTNLGYLYLQTGNTEQGNACFEKAKALRKQ